MDETPANQDILPPTPPKRTVEWVHAQGTTLWQGEPVPTCHRIPAGAELAPVDTIEQPSTQGGPQASVPGGQGARHCRVTVAGERCKARMIASIGLCPGHAGVGGAADMELMRERSSEARATVKLTRQVLGINARRSLDPRSAARLRASLKATQLAKAIVDGPLEDPSLSSAERQKAALAALDATFPLQTVTAELSLSDPEGMDWKSMQRLAGQLLG